MGKVKANSTSHFLRRIIVGISLLCSFLLVDSAFSAPPQTIEMLIEELQDADKEVRAKAASKIVPLGQKAKAAIPALVAAFRKDPYYTSFPNAFVAIGAPSVTPLMALLSDKDADVRRKSIAALGRIGEPARESIPHLRKALSDSDIFVRDNAVKALRNLGAIETALPDLIGALKFGDWTCSSIAQSIAATRLPKVKRKVALKAFGDLAKDGNARAQVWALYGLAALSEDPEPHVDALIRLLALRRGQFAETDRQELRQGLPASIVPKQGDQYHLVRKDAALALGLLGERGKKAVPALRTAADKDPHRLTRLQALMAIKSILKPNSDPKR